MAVAVMAALAVIGFAFVSSMKIEQSVTACIRNRTQAGLAARAALQLFPGVLQADAMAEPSNVAGGISDHFTETLYKEGLSQILNTWGNLYVWSETGEQPYYGGTKNLRDESSKMNLNAFGNLAKWDYETFLNDESNLDAIVADEQLYHGKNHRYSSFEISFEEFFYYYYKDGKIWASGQPYELTGDDAAKKARVRCANLARAICLYRWGGRRDADSNGTPDFEGDGKPGVAGVDDDKDNDFGTNGIDDNRDGRTDAADPDEVGFGLQYDGIDNDGDGEIDEDGEGIDEPDEFNPYRLAGDDEAFTATAELVGCIANPYNVTGVSSPVPAACNYTGNMTAEQIEAEANRLYEIVKSELTVYSYSLDARSVSIDDPATDGYDNDGDGLIDADDDTGAKTIAEIVDQLDGDVKDGVWEKTIYDVDINEKEITNAAQAAYIYLKMNAPITYTGSTEQPLVAHFTIKNALDIVDFRDSDPIPTVISVEDATLLKVSTTKPFYGMEGLHVTEIGRYIDVGANLFAAGGTNTEWTGTAGTCTYAADAGDTDTQKRTGEISCGGMSDGKYMVKMTVTVPANGKLILKDRNDSNTRPIASGADQTVWYGPVETAAGTGMFKALATSAGGDWPGGVTDGSTFEIKNVEVYLPYVEIMNWSKKDRLMTRFSLQIGPTATAPKVSLAELAFDKTESPANGDDHTVTDYQYYIPGHRTVATGYDDTNGHGAYYGHFVIVYDITAFEALFSDAAKNGSWGDGAEDFNIAAVQAANYGDANKNPFYDGLDGSQGVTLYDGTTIVGGGPVDDITSEHNGASGLTLSSTNLALARSLLFSDSDNPGLNATDGFLWCRVQTDGGTGGSPSWSPGRWKVTSFTWSHSTWPTLASIASSKNCPVVGDRGVFGLPGSVGRVNASALSAATTMAYCNPDQYLDRHPDVAGLFAYAACGRYPARINVNTASLPVLAACLATVPGQADPVTWISDNRPFKSAQSVSEEATLNSLVGDGVDNDGNNAKDEYAERLEWFIRNSGAFVLRGHTYSVAVVGVVRDSQNRDRARVPLSAVFDRGRQIGSDGQPVVKRLLLAPVQE
jgi:hypothetical protein